MKNQNQNQNQEANLEPGTQERNRTMKVNWQQLKNWERMALREALEAAEEDRKERGGYFPFSEKGGTQCTYE